MTDAFYDSHCRVQAEKMNDLAVSDPKQLVALSEQRYEAQIRNVCSYICNNMERSHIVLLAGPSASGKTTTAHKFRKMLKEEFYVNSYVVSLDDFYIDQCRLPTLPDGSKDLETVYALDIDCIHQCFDQLTNTRRASLPTFDFHTASRSIITNDITLGDHEILIVEGIHALNPLITEGLDASKFFRLFISVKGEYSLNNEVVLTHEDLRFIRRCVRDYYHRDSSLERTTGMWASVRAGEKKYISPYKCYANLTIDSLILYEPCIFHHFLCPLIEQMDPKCDIYPRFERLYHILQYFAEFDRHYVSEDSLLREFID
ncbi:uridine kinase family protein [Acetanaerobacterium elongatum]|uniref:Uridine kinase n=1 Tax=Acetanaerobacterium elongatum TaxID=258515 RepID=A0A1H0A6E7_9FIRM|nr:hypothetical protein [Acetanaerobacterium elongatum]SDN29362.1 uridine kinase [Acetanaerobacterium elongatum]